MARSLRVGLAALLMVVSSAMLLAQGARTESANLQLVLDWYREVIAAGRVDGASKYMADSYVEHDPNIGGGLKEFVAFYRSAPLRPGQPALPAKPAVSFARGDYVLLQWDVADKDARTGTPYEYSAFDVVRVKDGRIQERWNSNQKVNPNAAPVAPSKPGTYPVQPGIPMNGALDSSSLQYTPAEKEMIDRGTALFRVLSIAHHYEKAPDILDFNRFIQHNPTVPTTAEGLIEYFKGVRPPGRQEIQDLAPAHLLLYKDGIVMFFRERPTGEYGFEMVRVENGKITEHWDAAHRKSTAPNAALEWCVKSGRPDCPKP